MKKLPKKETRSKVQDTNDQRSKTKDKFQLCLKCGSKIGVLSGGFDAICQNCGWKDPCCE